MSREELSVTNEGHGDTGRRGENDKRQITSAELAETIRDHTGDLSLRNLAVDGDINLAYTELGAVRIIGCTISGMLKLRDAKLRRLWVADSQLGRINATGLSVDQRAEFRRVATNGNVDLSGASAGRLAMWWCTIGNEDETKHELDLAVLDVSRSLSLRGTVVNGTLKLSGSRVGGELSLRDMQINSVTNAWAVKARELRTGRSLWARGLNTSGGIDLTGAEIGGALDLANVDIGPSRPGVALNLFGAETRLSVDLRGAQLHAQLRLRESKIGGVMNLAGATLRSGGDRQDSTESPDVAGIDPAVALDASHSTFSGGVVLSTRPGTSQLQLDGPETTTIEDEDDESFRDAERPAPTEPAALSSHGSLSFDYSRIGSELSVDNVELTNQEPGQHIQFSAVGATVSGPLTWRAIQLPADGQLTVDLTDASVARLSDDAESWGLQPDGTRTHVRCRLNGFTYDSIDLLSGDHVGDRVRWLNLMEVYDPGPYRTLASAYRGQGREGDALTILSESEEARRKRATPSLLARFWNRLLGWTTGHGYHLERALGGLVLLLAVTTALVTVAAFQGGFVSTAKVSGTNTPVSDTGDGFCPPDPGACFNPIAYTVDSVFPVIKFGQTGWVVDGTTGWGQAVQVWLTFATAIGWLLGIATVAAVSQVLVRDKR